MRYVIGKNLGRYNLPIFLRRFCTVLLRLKPDRNMFDNILMVNCVGNNNKEARILILILISNCVYEKYQKTAIENLFQIYNGYNFLKLIA